MNRFTEKLQEAIRAAQSKATRYGHQQIDVEHLLDALLEQEGGLAASILLRTGIQLDEVGFPIVLASKLMEEDALAGILGRPGTPPPAAILGILDRFGYEPLRETVGNLYDELRSAGQSTPSLPVPEVPTLEEAEFLPALRSSS